MGTTMTRWLCAKIPSMDYHEALELQRALVDAKIAATLSRDVLMLLEHPPVFTLGRRAAMSTCWWLRPFLNREEFRSSM